MPAPDQEYRSLMLRKAQLLAQQHGGLTSIPRKVQRRLAFDVIIQGKGSLSVSVRIPGGDLSSSISRLKAELSAEKAFAPHKPSPDQLGECIPIPPAANQTMDDFWVMREWYKEGQFGIRLTNADWSEDDEVREKAVRFLVEKALRKDPRDVTYEDFDSNRLESLLVNYYKGSPHLALTEAGYAYSAAEALRHANEGAFHNEKFYPWEMSRTPTGFYESKENRIAAIKWLVAKLGKGPRNISEDDFNTNRLSGLLDYYNDSPYSALLEAGIVNPEDERYMRRHGHTRFLEV